MTDTEKIGVSIGGPAGAALVQSETDRREIEQLRAEVEALRAVYVAANELVVMLGYKGEITTRAPECDKLMTALQDCDAARTA